MIESKTAQPKSTESKPDNMRMACNRLEQAVDALEIQVEELRGCQDSSKDAVCDSDWTVEMALINGAANQHNQADRIFGLTERIREILINA